LIVDENKRKDRRDFVAIDRIFTGIGCPGVTNILSHELVV
jgi:hypothetical protein